MPKLSIRVHDSVMSESKNVISRSQPGRGFIPDISNGESNWWFFGTAKVCQELFISVRHHPCITSACHLDFLSSTISLFKHYPYRFLSAVTLTAFSPTSISLSCTICMAFSALSISLYLHHPLAFSAPSSSLIIPLAFSDRFSVMQDAKPTKGNLGGARSGVLVGVRSTTRSHNGK